MAVGYRSTQNPKDAAQNDRDTAAGRGDWLHQSQVDRMNQENGKREQYENWLNSYMEPWAQGQGGYSPEEQANILQQDELDRLQNFDARGNYLTDDETSGMRGDTGSYGQFFDPDLMSQNQDVSAGRQRQAAYTMGDKLRGAANNDGLKQSEGYRRYSQDTLRNTGENVRGVLNNTYGAVRGAIDPEKLTTSQGFLDSYEMSPEEQQDIVTGAGISEGTGYRARMDDVRRSAAAAGMDPVAVAAMQNRMERQSAGAAGDAMTKARVDASNAAAQRQLSGEQLRRSGEQDLAQLRTGTELAMGRDTAANEQELGARDLAQQNEMERQRLGAEQYRTGTNMAAERAAGEADMNTEQAINSQGRQQAQFNAQQGFAINKARDEANAARSADIAKNRQSTGRYNQEQAYGRGMDRQQALSGRYKQIADTRKQDQNTALGYFGQQNSQANQNAQNDANRQIQTYGVQTGAQNAATGNIVKADQKPSWWERAISAGAQAAGAVTGAMNAGGGKKRQGQG